MTLQMTVLKIVQVIGVVMHMKMIVVYVMMTPQMIMQTKIVMVIVSVIHM